uniref:Uncharacterized protein n=1 Tax=Strigamia maritima TaxID=126957 RepID=T1IZW0_STRMM
MEQDGDLVICEPQSTVSLLSLNYPSSRVEPASCGLDDLHKIIEKNNKTQKIASDASSSLSHLIKNANEYIMEMQLLEDLENLLKDNGPKRQLQNNNNLLTDNNWAKLYGLDMNQDVAETYSKIRQNIQQLIFEADIPLEESAKDNSSEKSDINDKNYPLKRALRCLKQEQRPQSTSAIERPTGPVPKVRGILNSRPKTSKNELQTSTAAKKSVNMPPRNAVSEEDASKLSATKDNRCVWADCDGLWPIFNFEVQNQQNRRNLKDLISIDYLPTP